jgi:outer membrane protein OmpA-like peptidoglycan-associated protein
MWAASSATGGQLNKDFLCWDDRNGEPNLAAIAPQPIGIGYSGFGVITYPANGSTIYTNTPIIAGTTSDPSQTFSLNSGAVPAQSVTSNDAGNWSYPSSGVWSWTYGSTVTVTLSNTGWPNNSTTFTIACPPGKQLSSGSCVDVDECATVTPNGGCGSNATCSNTDPGRTCTCDAGYTGDGIVCSQTLTNTVAITSPANGSNINTVTPTVGGTATPNTVVTLTYGNNSTTITSNGSGNWSFPVPTSWGLMFGSPSVTFIASVSSGVTSRTTVSILCDAGYSASGQTCTDIDECAENNGGCDSNATCTDRAGLPPLCACNAGYDGNGIVCTFGGASPSTDQIFIVDPADGSNLTTTTPTVRDNENLNSATNSTPSISFTLTDGTSSTSSNSTDGLGLWSYQIPASWNWRWGSTVMLTAYVSSGQSSRVFYSIPCPPGTEANAGGTACVDVNECSQTGVCPSGHTCSNTDGSFLCLAPAATPTPTAATIENNSGTTDNLGDVEIQGPEGMKAVGSGCTMRIGGDNGLGSMMFGLISLFLARRSRRRLRQFFGANLPFLMVLVAVAAALLVPATGRAEEGNGSLDVEQFDAVVPGEGALNQPYGRVDSLDAKWMLGLGVQYSLQPLRLVRAVPTDTRKEGDVVPAMLRWEFLARKMLGAYADFQVAVPYVDTLGDPDWTIGGRSKSDLTASTLGDVRTSLGLDIMKLIKGSPERRPGGFGLALRTTVWTPVGGDKTVAALHGEESARYEPRIVADYLTSNGYHFGLGVGYHIRKKSQILHVVNGSAYRWGVFAEGPLWRDSKWVGTFFGAEQTAKQIDPQDPESNMPSNVFSPREVMGGVVSDYGKLMTTFAMGVGLNGAVGSPKRRYLAQVAYSLDEIKMRDSVVDREERKKEKEKEKEQVAVAACPSGKTCERVINVSIYFLTGSSHIRVEQARKVSEALAQIKPGERVIGVEVEGRTDNRGSKEYNRALSGRRADSAFELLSSGGIPRSIMKVAGFGFEKPVAHNNDETGRQKNRQVDIRIKVSTTP